MEAHLTQSSLRNKAYSIQVTGSKSESNRLLILQALYPSLRIENLSESDDTIYLTKALQTTDEVVDIHHAGTAMRFLTAYFASQAGREVLLTGSKRMQERPIGILVDALRSLGADIVYENETDYPPLRIKGTRLQNNEVSIKANTSSQYISALMLIAPSLPNGLKIHLEGESTSVPYLKMTFSLLERIGIQGTFTNTGISLPACPKIGTQTLTVESDWSSASYFYSIVALSGGLEIQLKSYRASSLQGDSALSEIYQELGVTTEFQETEQAISLRADSSVNLPNILECDLVDTPDIAQTIAVSCFGLGIGCHLTGLHTLKIKETDRLVALQRELGKLGAKIEVTDDSLRLDPRTEIRPNIEIETYNDHRMAMAFAPLALKTSIRILDCEVVSKSFPTYWTDLQTLGFSVDLQ